MSSRPSDRIDGPVSEPETGEPLAFPASYAQERMWFFYRLDSRNVQYNVPLLLRLAGDPDTDALVAALNDVTARHETLRTTFSEDGGALMQVVTDRLVLPLPTTDLSALTPRDGDVRVTEHEPVRARLAEEIRRPFDLESGPLLRARLFRFGPADHLLLVCVHHIVIDGWSAGVFVRELAEAYRARTAGAAPDWAPLEIQYGDFAEWQREQLDGRPLADGLDHWRERLAGDLPALRLPADRPEPRQRSLAGDRIDFSLPPGLTARIKRLCRDEGATLYMALLAGFTALLRRYTGQDDILVGSPTANRDNAQVEPLIGMFVNTLPLRVDTSDNPSFAQLLQRVREVALDAFAHQHIPLEKIVEAVAPQRDPGGNPLFQVVFALQNFARPEIELPGLTVSPVGVQDWTCRFDLELHLWEQGAGLRGNVVFATDLFDRRTAERLVEHLRRVYETVTADPERRLADLPLVGEAEQRRLDSCGADLTGHDPAATVPQRFAAHAATRPEAVAVQAAGRTAAYREIDERSNALARHLVGRGVQPGGRVALLCARGADTVIGLLAAMKAGAACVPLDPADPPVRLRHLLRAADASCVLATDVAAATGLAEDGADVPAVIGIAAAGDDRGDPAEQPAVPVDGGTPALVLSAGPHTVSVDHAALVCHLDLLAGACGLTAADAVACWAPAGTQRSVWEALLPLCHGARLSADDGPPERQCAVSPGQAATLALAVDRDLARLESAPWPVALRTVLCVDRGMAGERASRFVRSLGGRLRLAYCTAASGPAAFTPEGADAPSCRPVRPVRVLDAYGTPAPVGVFGSVHLGGPGLATVQPAVTAAQAGEPLLRTGSTGRITADGTLEITGHGTGPAPVADHTVDLDEVAARIMEHESVRDCVVRVKHTTSGVAELVAYAVPTRDVAEAHLVRATRPVLPAALPLAAVVLVSDLPRTPAGRLDEAALSRFPVPDEALLEQWEQRWRSAVGADRAAVALAAAPVPAGTDQDARPAGPATDGKTPAPHPAGAPPAISTGPALPDIGVRTLAAALRRSASAVPRGETVFITSDGAANRQSYAVLTDEASRLLGGLRGLGLRPGAKVVLQFDDNRGFVIAFWACVLGGFVAVPLAAVPDDQPDGAAAAKLEHARRMLDAPWVLTDRTHAGTLRRLLVQGGESDPCIAVLDDLCTGPADDDWHPGKEDDLVLLMLTSGSTGTPKAVRLRHDNLLAHAAAARQRHDLTPADVAFNWMPMEHVGGLIMSHVRNVVVGCRQVHAPTPWVLEDPLRWLSALHTYRATVTWAPNFAYGLINERAAEIAGQRWDLSALRLVLNGGEAVVDRVARRFVRLLAPHGLPPTAMRPIWGMSETSSGQIDAVLPAEPDDAAPAVEVGRPYPGLALRIVDDQDTVVSEGTVGHLQVSGPAVTPGYHGDPEQNRAAFTDDGWFRTGDLGLLRDGALTVTGRAKDIVIVGGVNHPSHELEEAVEELDVVTRSFTAACAVRTAHGTGDELALFFVPEPGAAPRAAAEQIRAKLLRDAGVNPSYLIPLRREQIPKTEIGKIQRSRLRAGFEAGEYAEELRLTGGPSGAEGAPARGCHRPVWQPADRPHAPAADGGGHTLLLADRHGLADRLAETLREQGAGCTLVRFGTAFVRHAADRFDLPWYDAAELGRLLDAVPPVDRVVHLASWGPYAGEPDRESLAVARRDGVDTLVHLVTALADRGRRRTVEVNVVSCCGRRVLPEDRLAVERTPAVGLLKSLGQEVRWLRGRYIDIPEQAGEETVRELADELGTPPGETEVALRAGKRWVRRLARLSGDAAPEAAPVFRDGGWYVVSGGLGDLAVAVARHLLPARRVRLLLLGRTALPDETSWDRHIAAGGPLGRKLAAYRELRATGGVRYAAVDVTDAEAVRRAVDAAARQWAGEPDGVLHLAGHFEECPVTEQSESHRAAVLDPKIHGGWALHQLVKDRPGTLFLSFSSVNGFFGGSGAGAYAAANAFLDALAEHQRTHCGVDGRSLAWTMWDDLGMSRDYALRELTEARGYRVLTAREALRCLDAALGHAEPHVLLGLDPDATWIRSHLRAPAHPLWTPVGYVLNTVAERPATELPDRYGTPTRCEATVVDELPRTADGTIDRDRLAHTTPSGHGDTQDAEPSTERERAIAGIWREVLERDRIGVRDNFFALGGHSILATRLLSRLRADLGIDVSVAALFDDPTIAGLAARAGQTAERPPQAVLDVLLPLRPHGSRPALFCVHPGAGVSWPYAALLGGVDPDRPVHGIQARGLNAAEPRAASVADMAADYLRQIRSVQPHGPYHLLGWSFGGLVAHEMAVQLRAAGDQVGLLAMLDAWPVGADPDREQPPAAEELEPVLMDILVKSAGLREQAADTPLTRARTLELLQREDSPLQGMDDEAVSALLAVMADNTELGHTYVPGHIDHDLVFFSAGDGRFASVPPAEKWRPFVGGSIRQHVVPGAHGDMLRPEPAARIARIADAEMKRVER
ncbi:SDR family oxidoreductase [Streptomyces sp. NPDC059788]|uniref:SDR family oxidoreductase n=1 Tax=Streptomyces sp. NPDC059788 TaxID=3346948 RepID=UPI003664AC13